MEKNKLNYKNTIILAPMVRVGTLPMRLLALEYGADIVYSEELIDWKLLKSKRRVNDVLKTIDFVDQSDGTVVFRTCEREKCKVILQIGTACAKRALMVGKMVENDVAGIDVNMGCPKEFSIKGGMGAALLSNIDNAKSILKNLVNNLKIPVSCKIRILPNVDDTINLVKEFESIGICAIGIHGRTKAERPQHPVHPEVIREVVKHVKIPVIANGGSKEIEKYSDIINFRKQCNANSVMIARAAQWNVSIFRKNGLLPIDDVISAYLKLCVEYDNTPSNSKYCVQSILRELQETPKGKRFLDSQTLEQICEVWDLGKYCRYKQLEYQEKGLKGRRDVKPNDVDCFDEGPRMKKRKIDSDIIQHNIAFIRSNYTDDPELPKSKLHVYAGKKSLSLPTYKTEQEDKLFRTILIFDNKKYASTYWEKNKKFAEQGAAMVCLLSLGLINETTLIENGSILK